MDPPAKSRLADRYYFESVKPSDDYDQFWIRYKPERVESIRWQRLKPPQRWLIFLCVFAALACSFACSLAFWAVAACAAAIYFGRKLQFVTYPTHISFTDSGIQLHWLRSYCNLSSAVIRWDRLTHVSVRKQHYASADESILEFNLVAADMAEKQRLAYQLIAPELTAGWFRGDRCKLMVRLDAIASSDDRKRLQLALKKFLPSFRIEPSVSDELSMGLRVQNYTDLWMDALNSNARRLREDPLEPGVHVLEGAYEIVKQIGAGGQALVYEATKARLPILADADSSRPEQVVLKEFVLPAHAGAAVRKRVLEHIQREAELLKILKHPNVVKLQEFFVEDQRAYLVLERINGTSLKEIVEKKGALSESECVLFGLQMCEILGYLHSQSVVHRDFTPDNLILAYGDIVKLIDFNVAMQLEADGRNSVVGKHAFIPPEQFRGKATFQSDIYAVGGTLHFLSTGVDPEPISCSHPREIRSDLSAAFDAIVARATSIELASRYADCVQLREDLQQLKQLYAC
ncbi:MAG TPA: serine/threonine-protein kinase [Planktothrix sp.]|jgi:tRNA A-37 threonylcarbamoyl transferase component Bud32